MKRPAPKVGTLAGLVRDRFDVHVFCYECRHNVKLRPEDLAARHGEALPVQRFLERSVCSKCRARWPRVDLQVVPRLAEFTGYPPPAFPAADGEGG